MNAWWRARTALTLLAEEQAEDISPSESARKATGECAEKNKLVDPAVRPFDCRRRPHQLCADLHGKWRRRPRNRSLSWNAGAFADSVNAACPFSLTACSAVTDGACNAEKMVSERYGLAGGTWALRTPVPSSRCLLTIAGVSLTGSLPRSTDLKEVTVLWITIYFRL